jgi:MOSC domain-containing protein YiiM
VLEVSEPRIPCRVFAGFWQRPSLIKEFTDAKRSGTYLRIITEGEIKAGDSIEMIYRPEHQITILDIFSAKAGDREKIVEISQVTELSDKYRQWAKNLI